LSLLKQHLAAIAIVFDFMNPVLPLWRLFNRGSKLWFDKSEAGGYAKHYSARLKKKPELSDVRASSTQSKGETMMAGNHHRHLTSI
jgi:hypothetical protein